MQTFYQYCLLGTIASSVDTTQMNMLALGMSRSDVTSDTHTSTSSQVSRLHTRIVLSTLADMMLGPYG